MLHAALFLPPVAGTLRRKGVVMSASLLNPDALVKLVEDDIRRALKEHVPQTTEDIYLSVARV